ncbi:RNA-guided endonuclease InsQ/TnpB family protein [Thermoflavimicrobium dichotomicum]|uniref:Putative transposase n=1 Tax=Thermoflavimicrobium dichotomicum TaxID=46223 RepID=A0A1I3U2L7_9BACL|nr:RNA-guided endonuclease TnpB family protein [Thermoflavimicrobium dichotomicum]SFJ76993.1 putative transposase [Thermoflavimicrobium dichotomicum]
MLKAYKTELNPTPEQITKIVQSMGICRFLYNQYLGYNFARYEQGETFISGYDFDKYVNHELSKQYPWIKICGSKARKKAIMNAETAFKRFFKGQSRRPRFKKKKNQDVKVYFPKNNKGDLIVERHRIKIPTLGWVRLKEKGYIPTTGKVKSCTLTQQADRFYISVLVEVSTSESKEKHSYVEGIGMDLGIKHFAVLSNGQVFKNINRSSAIKRTEKRLKREQRALSRKYEFRKKRGETTATKSGSNIRKNILRVQKLHARLARMREAYRAFVVSMIAKAKPSYITIEKLNVQGMMKNRHLSKSIADQGFYDLKMKLLNMCTKLGIELREVNPFYPSSKLCSSCGHKKEKLSLSERIFQCESCGHTLDRDLNAAMNLMQAKEYVVLT